MYKSDHVRRWTTVSLPIINFIDMIDRTKLERAQILTELLKDSREFGQKLGLAEEKFSSTYFAVVST